MHTIQKLYKVGADVLKNANIDSYLLDARILLMHALKIKLEEFVVMYNQKVTSILAEKYFSYIEERKAEKPIAYIVGYKEFYGRVFDVTDQVLIPRPDSEILIDAILSDYISNVYIQKPTRVLELGAGSGCLILTVIQEILLKNKASRFDHNNISRIAYGTAVDISQSAIDVCKKNAQKMNVDSVIQCIHMNWLDFLKKNTCRNIPDIIIANPPYIRSNAVLSKSVYQYEPHIALFGGNDGLSSYKEIAQNIRCMMGSKTLLYVEIGCGMMDRVTKLFEEQSLALVSSYKDLNNFTRCLKFSL